MKQNSKSTNKQVAKLLVKALARITQACSYRPDLILAAWPEVIGKQLAPMTKAISFYEGVLTIRVKNSSLYSLLQQQERPKLLKNLREKFPTVEIRNIIFRMG